MLSYSDYLTEQKSKPIKLFHGAHVKQNNLRLPKTFSHARSADGHAIYMTNKKAESEDYGKHIHHVEFNAGPHELIDFEKPLSRQHPRVKKALKTIAPEAFEINPKNPKRLPQAQDAIEYLQKKHGPIKASRVLYNAGIKGGSGESLYGRGKNTKISRVYSAYNPKDIKVVKHEYSERGIDPPKPEVKPEPVAPKKTITSVPSVKRKIKVEPTPVPKQSILQKIRNYIKAKK